MPRHTETRNTPTAGRRRWKSARAAILGLAALVAASLVALWLWRPGPPAPASPHRPPGNGRMAARLARILEGATTVTEAATEDAAANAWLVNRPQMVAVYRAELARTTSFWAAVELRMKIARELLWDGKTPAAIEELGAVEGMVSDRREALDPLQVSRVMLDLMRWVSIAFLRLGEQQNCVAGHSPDSCLVPIAGSGVHRSQDGSRSAIAVLTKAIEASPDDLGSRWLLNLAYMTLGEYPGQVPERWLIPPRVFESEHDIGRFHDVAPAVGVDAFGLAGGCAVEDFDGDGLLDLFATSWSLAEQMRLFRNRGDGTFTERTEAAGLLGETGGLNCSHADYDNDGDADIFVRRGGWLRDSGLQPSSLLRNRGDGTFDDVTDEAGVETYHPGQVAAWGDYDNDGFVDLFLGSEMDSRSEDHPSQLFRNRGDGGFSECAASVGITARGFVKGAAWGDYDNDGLLDLYLSRLGDANVLYHNQGLQRAGNSAPSWRFADVTESAGVAEPRFSFPAWFWDYDNDGWLDIFVAGFNKIPIDDVAALYVGLPSRGETPRLYRNRRDGTFADVTREARLDRVVLVMGANYGDLDNDGFLDLYLGTGAPDLRTLMPNRMFRNSAGKVFQDVTTSGGFGHVQKGHGIAFADIDNDGDQDVYAVMGGWYTGDGFHKVLFENPGHGNHWVTLRLEGVRSNRAGIGARIKVTVNEGGEGGPAGAQRDIHATAGTGGSFGSSSLQQEIGLGKASSIAKVEVRWPASGIVQVLSGVPMDRIVKLREGHDGFTVVEAQRFRLARGRPNE